MANRGKKDCPNCKQEIAARSLLCPHCGYHYESKSVRKDLLEQKNEVKEITTFDKGGKGKKECPNCHVFVGAVTKTCPKCNFDFSSVKKEVKEEEDVVVKPKQEDNLLTRKILAREASLGHVCKVENNSNLTPIQHAQRILSYGKDRATHLVNLHKWDGGWNHVDWKAVEEGLVNLVA